MTFFKIKSTVFFGGMENVAYNEVQHIATSPVGRANARPYAQCYTYKSCV